jgi:cellulose synthase/poly-beta-1,6-N-acetylglucosamine synthase-like glycosyltransferase
MPPIPVLLASSLTVFSVLLSLAVGYLTVLTVVALIAHPAVPSPAAARRRFAILVPAHDEEALIGRLLANLAGMDYPRDRYVIHVVADNCEDRTASVARSMGARVHERFDLAERGKGFALRWLLGRLDQERATYDAFVVLDADSVVSPNFLRCMDSRLEGGSRVIQAYYSVLNQGESPVAQLRYAALAVVHYLRPLARSQLGLSCGLKGNGMCFSAGVLRQFAWRWFTLAEDVEFHLALVRGGLRVDFAPEATVLADMPISLAQAATQNSRWEKGRLDLVRRTVPSLILSGIKRRSLMTLDAALEQLIPPLSVPFAVGVVCLLGGLALGAIVPSVLSALSLGGMIAHLLSGLVVVRAPLRAYLALSYAPIYIAWKLSLYARALVNSRTSPWIRTARLVRAPQGPGPAAVRTPTVKA